MHVEEAGGLGMGGRGPGACCCLCLLAVIGFYCSPARPPAPPAGPFVPAPPWGQADVGYSQYEADVGHVEC